MKEEGISSGQLTRLEAIELLLHEVGTYPWNKLYSRRLFNNVSYPEGYIYEGTGTIYKTILLADKFFIWVYYCTTIVIMREALQR